VNHRRRSILLHTVALCAIAAGCAFLGARFRATTALSGAMGEGSTATAPARPPRPGAPATTPAAQGAHDLATLEKLRAAAGRTLSPEDRQLARLSTPALQDILLSQYSRHSGEDAISESLVIQNVTSRIVEELVRRDATTAYVWASCLSQEDASASIVDTIIITTARDQPQLASAWYEHHAEGRPYLAAEVWKNLIKGAVGRGETAEAARFVGSFTKGGEPPDIPHLSYPDGFDFRAFFDALHGKANLSTMLYQWALRDPDAAWAATGTRMRDGSLGPSGYRSGPFPTIFNSHLLRDGTEKGVAWAAAGLAAMSAEDRAASLEHLTGHAASISPGAIAALTSALPPADRNAFVDGVMKYNYERERNFAVLSVLPRAEMLRRLAKVYDNNRSHLEPTPPDPGNSINPLWAADSAASMKAYFKEAGNRFSLTPEELERIRATE